jgi:hypothetical protein
LTQLDNVHMYDHQDVVLSEVFAHLVSPEMPSRFTFFFGASPCTHHPTAGPLEITT